MPSESGTGEIRSQGQAFLHLSHRMQRERNSSSTTAPGGRLNLKSFRSKNRITPPRAIATAPFPTNPMNVRRGTSGSSPLLLPIPTIIFLHLIPCLTLTWHLHQSFIQRVSKRLESLQSFMLILNVHCLIDHSDRLFAASDKG